MIGAACPYDGSVCEVPGLGFRVLETTPTQCAINDLPCDKFEPCPTLDVLLMDFPRGDWAEAVANDFSAHPANVPVPSAGALMITLLAAAILARPLWHTASRVGDWFTRERGCGPQQNGWV
ncbi:hypothetical protein [uncultured Paracoccus sp.]|uniref:hypothetical protein n=1 Tax=uncultured Paracoccus sp. TaxID=189685 RepID=UPI0025DC167A|nr:hypothetical protein [uncultured Paracoccus sp.]